MQHFATFSPLQMKRQQYDNDFMLKFIEILIPKYNKFFNTNLIGGKEMVNHYCLQKQLNVDVSRFSWADIDRDLKDQKAITDRDTFSYKYFHDKVVLNYQQPWSNEEFAEIDKNVDQLIHQLGDNILHASNEDYNSLRKQIIDKLKEDMKLNNWVHPFKRAEDRIRSRVDKVVKQLRIQKHIKTAEDQEERHEQHHHKQHINPSNTSIVELKEPNQQSFQVSLIINNYYQLLLIINNNKDLFPQQTQVITPQQQQPQQQQQQPTYDISDDDSQGSQQDYDLFDDFYLPANQQPQQVDVAQPQVQTVKYQQDKRMDSDEIDQVLRQPNPDMSSNSSTVASAKVSLGQDTKITYPNDPLNMVDQSDTNKYVNFSEMSGGYKSDDQYK